MASIRLLLLAVVLLGFSIPAGAVQLRGQGAKALQPQVLMPDIAGLIFETRPHVVIPAVVMNLRQRLPDMPLQLFYGKQNEAYVKHEPTLQKLVAEGHLTLTPVPGKFFEEKLTWHKYSILLETPAFWKATLPARKLLLVQTDSWACKDASIKIKEFLKYDYVGGPWAAEKISQERGFEGPWKLVGNGGTSLRDRAAMINITETYGPQAPENFTAAQDQAWTPNDAWSAMSCRTCKYPYDPMWSEDHYFCERIANTPEAAEANKFSLGEVWRGDESAMVHKPWVERWWESKKERVEQFCPGVSLLWEFAGKNEKSPDFAQSEKVVQRAAAIYAKEEDSIPADEPRLRHM